MACVDSALIHRTGGSCSTISVQMLNVEVALKGENWLNKRTAVELGPYFFVSIDKVYSK